MNDGLNSLQSFIAVEINPQLLEKTLVGRKNIVDDLEQLVIESVTTGNKHQRLLIGPRGSGKTHTLKVLHNRLSSNHRLKNDLVIAYLNEDEYGVATYLDWLVRLLKSFIKWYPMEAQYLGQEIEKLKSTPISQQEQIAERLLLNHINERTVLIIVENLGNIFSKTKGFGINGQSKFRDLIQQNPVFTIMGSNQSLFEDIQHEAKPFYNFFRIIELLRLTFDESIELLKRIAKWDKKENLVAFLNKAEGRGRMRAIYSLIGGNHRLLVTFYQFLRMDFINKLSETFIKTINDLIPYYQSMMDLLTSQQQKIIQYLTQVRTPVNVKTIAENCFSKENTISKQLHILEKLNYVDSISKFKGKETYYELAEPLLRICNEIKENRGGPVKLFIDFLGNLYTVEEIKKKFYHFSILSSIQGLPESISCLSEHIYYEEALKIYHPDMYKSLKEFKSFETERKLKTYVDELEQNKYYEDIVNFLNKIPIRNRYISIKMMKSLDKLDKYDDEIKVANELLSNNPKDMDALNTLGRVYYYKNNYEEASRFLLKILSIDNDNYEANLYLGCILGNHEKHNEAEEYFRKITELKPENSEGWRLLGVSQGMQNKLEEAEKSALKSLELNNTNYLTYRDLGIIKGNQGDDQKAEEYFKKATELNPEYSECWRLLGVSKEKQNKTEEAEKDILKSLELDNTDYLAYRDLGIIKKNQRDYQKAEEYFRKTTEIKPEDPIGWRLLGNSQEELKMVEEAENSYLKSLELDNTNYLTYLDLGIIMGNQGDNQKAEEYFRKVTELKPEHSEGWRLLGYAQFRQTKYKESEKCFLKTLELKPHNFKTIIMLVLNLFYLNKFKKAERYCHKLIDSNEEDVIAWIFLGQAQRFLNKNKEAELSWSKALELDEGKMNHYIVERLGELYLEDHRYDKAEEYLSRLTKLQPENFNSWKLLGQTLKGQKKFFDARHCIEKALKINNEDKGTLLELIDILIKLNDIDELSKKVTLYTQKYKNTNSLNTLGELFRKSKEYKKAINIYQQAFELDKKSVWPIQNLISCNLGLNNISEALQWLNTMLNVIVDIENKDILIVGFEENYTTMLMEASEANVRDYLNESYAKIIETNFISYSFRSWSNVVFALLREYNNISVQRFDFILGLLKDKFSNVQEISLPIKFLEVGILNLVKKDKKALLRLTKEERKIFQEFVLDKVL